MKAKSLTSSRIMEILVLLLCICFFVFVLTVFAIASLAISAPLNESRPALANTFAMLFTGLMTAAVAVATLAVLHRQVEFQKAAAPAKLSCKLELGHFLQMNGSRLSDEPVSRAWITYTLHIHNLGGAIDHVRISINGTVNVQVPQQRRPRLPFINIARLEPDEIRQIRLVSSDEFPVAGINESIRKMNNEKAELTGDEHAPYTRRVEEQLEAIMNGQFIKSSASLPLPTYVDFVDRKINVDLVEHSDHRMIMTFTAEHDDPILVPGIQYSCGPPEISYCGR